MTSHMEVMQLCRLCLEKEQVNVQIFEDSDIERQVHHKISTCLPVKVEKEDILPKKICDGCMYKLDILYEFWTTCANAETQLNEWLQESEFAVTEEEAEIDTKHEALCHGEEETLEEVAEIAQDALEEEVVSEPPPKRIKKIAENNEIGIELMTVAKTEVESDEEQAEETVYEEQPIDVPGPSGISQTDTKADTTPIGQEETIQIDTTNGPKLVPRRFVLHSNSQAVPKKILIRLENGRLVPLLTKLSKATPESSEAADENKSGEEEDEDSETAKEKRVRYPPWRTHLCEHCGMEFPNVRTLKNHKKSHEPRQCHVCKKVLAHAISLKKHMVVHSGVRFECDICDRSFSTKMLLETHKRRHIGDYLIKCEDCKKGFYSIKTYNYHMESVHKGIRYTCSICGSVIKNYRYYLKHKEAHKTTEVLKFECEICHKFYSTKCILVQHMKIHSGPNYVCDICGKKSVQKKAHDDHMLLHTGEKRYQCNICGMDYRRKQVLDYHMRRIHGLSKVQCPICKEIFDTEYKMNAHLHTHDDVQKPFPCDQCDEAFIDKKFLLVHVNKVHIEQEAKPTHTCPDCGMVFQLRCMYNKHIKKHCIPCPNCGQVFKDKIDLEQHLAKAECCDDDNISEADSEE